MRDAPPVVGTGSMMPTEPFGPGSAATHRTVS